jgi:hypothetical protein
VRRGRRVVFEGSSPLAGMELGDHVSDSGPGAPRG